MLPCENETSESFNYFESKLIMKIGVKIQSMKLYIPKFPNLQNFFLLSDYLVFLAHW